MSHERLDGALCVDTERGEARITVQRGRVVGIEGIPDLLAALAPRLPDPGVLSGVFSDDLSVCMALGLGLDEVFGAASQRTGSFLARHEGQQGRFEVGAKGPAGSFPLPEGLLRLYCDAVSASDPDAIAERYVGRHGETLRVLVRPEEAEGLDPVSLRTLRAAWRAGDLADLIATAQSPTRLQQTWTSLALLIRMGLVVVGREETAPQTRGTPPAKAPPVAPEPEDDPDEGFDYDGPADDDPSELAMLDAGGDEVFALGEVEDHEEDEEDEEEDDTENDEEEDEREGGRGLERELSSLESDVESDDLFAMGEWPNDEGDEDDEDDEDDGSEETGHLDIEDADDDVEVDPNNPLGHLLGHEDAAVRAMARFYTELRGAGPLAPLGLKGEDLDGYLTVERLRMRANRALGRWHPALHSHRPPEAQQAAMELYKLVESRFEAMSSLESLSEAIADLRRARGWPRTRKEDRAKAEAMHRRAHTLARGRAWEAVLVMAEKATSLAPGECRYHALDLLARATLEEMTPQSAVVNLDALPLRRAGDEALLNYTAAQIWELGGRDIRAIQRYERVLEQHPDHEGATFRVEKLRAKGGAAEGTDASIVGLLSGLFRRG